VFRIKGTFSEELSGWLGQSLLIRTYRLLQKKKKEEAADAE